MTFDTERWHADAACPVCISGSGDDCDSRPGHIPCPYRRAETALAEAEASQPFATLRHYNVGKHIPSRKARPHGRKNRKEQN